MSSTKNPTRKPSFKPTSQPNQPTNQPTINKICVISIPANPLTSIGLSTPFTVTGCDQTNPNEISFVEGVIYDDEKKQFFIYNPLIINAGTKPAINPTQPTLPVNATIGLWFGSNNNLIQLTGPGVTQGNCVNGITVGGQVSIFGQYAYCNAPKFFAVVNASKPVIPPLGTTKIGTSCLTTRHFGLVDADPSDNVVTKYIVTGNKQLAQFSAANLVLLNKTTSSVQSNSPTPTVVANGSDEGLLVLLQGIEGCVGFTAPDLVNNNVMTGAMALNELQASKYQPAPHALVPFGDPMTLLATGGQSLAKVNLYRRGVFQPANISDNQKQYCTDYMTIAPPRFLSDMPMTILAASPAPAQANNMFTFLCSRFLLSIATLQCTALTGLTPKVTTVIDGNGVTTSCQITATAVTSPPVATASNTALSMSSIVAIAVVVPLVALCFLIVFWKYRSQHKVRSDF